MLRIALVAAAVLLAGCKTSLTPLPNGENRTFEHLLRWAGENGTPGSVLVVKTPATNLIAAVGVANRKTGELMEADHGFRIASVSKAFVGVLAAQAVAEGKLNLDASITNYLVPEITDRIANSDQITMRHLLRHTSGIYDFVRSPAHVFRRNLTDRRGKWPAERDLKYAYGKRADFAPGTGWRYSTSGYILAGMILDGIYDRDHSLEVRDRILMPLGLTNTYCELMELPRGEMASGYENWFGLWWTDATKWAPMTGGMVSTAPDLARFIRAVVEDEDFLDSRTRSVIWGNRDEGKLGYDFGISLDRHAENAPWFFGHVGAAAGYLTIAYHQPDHDITIVYLANTSQMKARGLDRRRREFTKKLSHALFELSLEAKNGPVQTSHR